MRDRNTGNTNPYYLGPGPRIRESSYQPRRWPLVAAGALILGLAGGTVATRNKFQEADHCNLAADGLLEQIRCAWDNQGPMAAPPVYAGAPEVQVQTPAAAPEAAAVPAGNAPSDSPDLRHIAGFNGYTIPCEGAPRAVARLGGNEQPRADWNGIPDSGTIGEGSGGDPIKVYIREACDKNNIQTLVIVASIHGSENGGQFVGHELLFNTDVPDNWRIVVIPELNRYAVEHWQRKNLNSVDLNKNAPIGWESTNSGRTDPGGNNYRGPSSASEPETQTLMSFLSALGPVDLALYYHDRLGYAAPVGNTPQHFAEIYAAQTGLKVGKYNDRNNAHVTVDGALDTWHNHTTGSPAMLIEMTNDQSEPVIQRHVSAVLSVINQIG